MNDQLPAVPDAELARTRVLCLRMSRGGEGRRSGLKSVVRKDVRVRLCLLLGSCGFGHYFNLVEARQRNTGDLVFNSVRVRPAQSAQ